MYFTVRPNDTRNTERFNATMRYNIMKTSRCTYAAVICTQVGGIICIYYNYCINEDCRLPFHSFSLCVYLLPSSHHHCPRHIQYIFNILIPFNSILIIYYNISTCIYTPAAGAVLGHIYIPRRGDINYVFVGF